MDMPSKQIIISENRMSFHFLRVNLLGRKKKEKRKRREKQSRVLFCFCVVAATSALRGSNFFLFAKRARDEHKKSNWG